MRKGTNHQRNLNDEADAQLVIRVAQGDMIAMREIYDTYADVVHRFLQTRLRDEFEIFDIVHETMLSVWRGASKFEGRSSVRSWIITLARNKAVDYVRKQSRLSLAEPDVEIPDDEPDAEAIIAASQDAARLRACLDGLSESQRIVVHLAYFDDLTCRQISEVEAIPEGTVKTRIYHAKKLLMRCLSRS